MENFAPETKAMELMDGSKALSFDPKGDYPAWKKALKSKFMELLGKKPMKVKPNVRVEHENDCGSFIDRRFVFSSEAGVDVPCHLLIPKGAEGPLPVVICLQGHSTGMHISLGRPKYEGDAECIAGGRDFGLQAVAQGFAALVMEQRCFGERSDSRAKEVRHMSSGCHHSSMCELLVGRTMLGLRVWDVSRAIDAISEFKEADMDRIACMGNSGGGTVTYYAACSDDRIKAAMPSCAVCTFKSSIGSIDHCQCNYIPGIMGHVEMGDLAGLVAPKSLIIVAGRKDPIFPLSGVKDSFSVIQKIYKAEGHPDNCRLVLGPDGHMFYPDVAWPAFRELTKW